VVKSRGLRLSLAGFVVFFLGMLGLFVLPAIVAALTMLFGGMCVWIGFMMTLFHFYSGGSAEDGTNEDPGG
jgi:hypothetical protein